MREDDKTISGKCASELCARQRNVTILHHSLQGEACPISTVSVNRYLPEESRCRKSKHVAALNINQHIKFAYLCLS